MTKESEGGTAIQRKRKVKSRKVTTQEVHDPEVEEEEQDEQAAQNREDQEELEFDEILQEIGADPSSKATVSIYREWPQTVRVRGTTIQTAGAIGHFPLPIALDQIADSYGGGRYRFTFRKNNKYFRQTRIDIPGVPIVPSEAEDANGSGPNVQQIAQMIQDSQGGTAEDSMKGAAQMIAALSGFQKQDTVTPELVKAMVANMEREPKGGTNIQEMFSMLTTMMGPIMTMQTQSMKAAAEMQSLMMKQMVESFTENMKRTMEATRDAGDGGSGSGWVSDVGSIVRGVKDAMASGQQPEQVTQSETRAVRRIAPQPAPETRPVASKPAATDFESKANRVGKMRIETFLEAVVTDAYLNVDADSTADRIMKEGVLGSLPESFVNRFLDAGSISEFLKLMDEYAAPEDMKQIRAKVQTDQDRYEAWWNRLISLIVGEVTGTGAEEDEDEPTDEEGDALKKMGVAPDSASRYVSEGDDAEPEGDGGGSEEAASGDAGRSEDVEAARAVDGSAGE